MQFPLGFYKWSFEGGEFAVGILPNNVFYCASYPVHGSTWNVISTTSTCDNTITPLLHSSSLVIDWKRYGVYEFPFTTDSEGRIGPGHFHGRDLVFCGQCRDENLAAATSWRKLQFVREFTSLEKKLMGHGYGSIWDFSWSKGSFEVEFRFDSFQHFVCHLFPEHSHWDLGESAEITIHWGRYGIYELRENTTSGHLYGHAKGQPNNWRKATFKRALEIEEAHQLQCNHD